MISGGCVVGCCSGSDEGVVESDGGSEDASGGSVVWPGELGGQSVGMVDVVVAGLDVVDAGLDPDPGDVLDADPEPVRTVGEVGSTGTFDTVGSGTLGVVRSGTVGNASVGIAGSAGTVEVVGRTIAPPLPSVIAQHLLSGSWRSW
jgi:hypothetical protein